MPDMRLSPQSSGTEGKIRTNFFVVVPNGGFREYLDQSLGSILCRPATLNFTSMFRTLPRLTTPKSVVDRGGPGSRRRPERTSD